MQVPQWIPHQSDFMTSHGLIKWTYQMNEGKPAVTKNQLLGGKWPTAQTMGKSNN